jgi:hypothetical protein
MTHQYKLLQPHTKCNSFSNNCSDLLSIKYWSLLCPYTPAVFSHIYLSTWYSIQTRAHSYFRTVIYLCPVVFSQLSHKKSLIIFKTYIWAISIEQTYVTCPFLASDFWDRGKAISDKAHIDIVFLTSKMIDSIDVHQCLLIAWSVRYLISEKIW